MRITSIEEVQKYLIQYVFDKELLNKINGEITEALNERFIKTGAFKYGVMLTSEIDVLFPDLITEDQNNDVSESDDLYLGVVELNESQTAVDTIYGILLLTNKKYIIDTLPVSHTAAH